MTAPKPTGARLRLLMRLRSRRALETWRDELAKGKGVYAAAVTLDVSKTTAYALARDWPALAVILESGKLSIEERTAAAGKASALASAADPTIVERRNKAIRRSAKARRK